MCIMLLLEKGAGGGGGLPGEEEHALTLPPGDTAKELEVSVSPGAGW